MASMGCAQSNGNGIVLEVKDSGGSCSVVNILAMPLKMTQKTLTKTECELAEASK